MFDAATDNWKPGERDSGGDEVIVSPVEAARTVMNSSMNAEAATVGGTNFHHWFLPPSEVVLTREALHRVWSKPAKFRLSPPPPKIRIAPIAWTGAPLDRLGSQALLPLGGSFAPTKELVAFWKASEVELLHEAGRPEESASLRRQSVSPALQHEFARIVQNVIGSLGQRLRYSGASRFDLLHEGRFSIQFQFDLLDVVNIIPDMTTAFLDRLRIELTIAVQQGAKLGGVWGQVLAFGADLVFVLERPSIDEPGGFIVAEDVEEKIDLPSTADL